MSALTSLVLVLGVLTHMTDRMVADAVQRTMFNRYLIGQAVGVPALVLGQQLFSFLALEEMAGNIVEHGYPMDNREKHSIDIRVIHREEDVILRLRDDCRPFDPSKRDLLLEPEDKAHNIGIRMVYRIAKEVEYKNLLGCNALTVKI